MKHVRLTVLTALFLATLFNQDALLKTIFGPDNKVAVPISTGRTTGSDSQYYYILAKKSAARLNPLVSAEEQQENFLYANSGQENLYPGALLLAGLLDDIAKLLPLKWNIEVLLSIIFQLGFLFAGLIAAYLMLRGPDKTRWLEIVLFGCFWALLARIFIYGVYFGKLSSFWTLPAVSYYPDILRLVNPQLTWAFSLFYVALLVSYLQNATRNKYTGLLLLSLFFGSFSIALTATMLLGLGLYGLGILLRHRTFNIPIFCICMMLLLSILLIRYQFYLYSLTDKGQAFQTGHYLGLTFKSHYLYLLLLLPLIVPFIPKNSRNVLICLYFSSVLLGSVGESFQLGSRLWLRGCGLFVWFMLAYGLTEIVRFTASWLWQHITTVALLHRCKNHLENILSLSLVCGISVYVFFALNINFDGWYGYIDKEKAEVVDWLQTHADGNTVILSGDFEDAFLVPVYTDAQPYVQLFDSSPLDEAQLISRYFQSLDLLSLKSTYLPKILAYDRAKHIGTYQIINQNNPTQIDYESYQIYTFYSMLIYYPYNSSVKDIFKTKLLNDAFDQKITSVAANSSAQHIEEVTMIIFNKGAGMRKPVGMTTLFNNNKYEILAPDGK